MVVGIQKCLVDVTGVAWSQKYPRKILGHNPSMNL